MQWKRKVERETMKGGETGIQGDDHTPPKNTRAEIPAKLDNLKIPTLTASTSDTPPSPGYKKKKLSLKTRSPSKHSSSSNALKPFQCQKEHYDPPPFPP